MRDIKFRAWDGKEMFQNCVPFPKTSEIMRVHPLTKELVFHKEETGNILKLTRERVRQIEYAALRKLRQPKYLNRLNEYK